MDIISTGLCCEGFGWKRSDRPPHGRSAPSTRGVTPSWTQLRPTVPLQLWFPIPRGEGSDDGDEGGTGEKRLCLLVL